MGKQHGMLMYRAGKVKAQTPKKEKDVQKPKQKVGRAKKRCQFNKANLRSEQLKQMERYQEKLEKRDLSELTIEVDDDGTIVPIHYYENEPSFVFEKEKLKEVLKVGFYLLLLV